MGNDNKMMGEKKDLDYGGIKHLPGLQKKGS